MTLLIESAVDSSLENVLAQYSFQQPAVKSVYDSSMSIEKLEHNILSHKSVYNNLCQDENYNANLDDTLKIVLTAGECVSSYIDKQQVVYDIDEHPFYHREFLYWMIKHQLHSISATAFPNNKTSYALRELGYDMPMSSATLQNALEKLIPERKKDILGYSDIHRKQHHHRLSRLLQVLHKTRKTPEGETRINLSYIDKELVEPLQYVQNFLPEKWIRCVVEEGYKLAYNNKVGEPSRCYYDEKKIIVSASRYCQPFAMLAHEIVHAVENSHPSLESLSNHYYNMRTYDPIYELDDKSFNNEKIYVKKGDFISPYMGRTYANSSAKEILSTGIESILGGSYGGLVGSGIWLSDPQHRNFTLGILVLS